MRVGHRRSVCRTAAPAVHRQQSLQGGDNRGMTVSSLARWLPFLKWPSPDAELLRGEFWAGMTVGLMLVPQGVAYAALAGMPLVTGIYASLLPALVAVLWGSSSRLSVGPTALTSLLIGASLTGLAEPGSAQWVALAAWMALLTGALQLLLGLVRFGWLLNLVTSPVLSGFTQAAALLILASQLPALTGLRVPLADLAASPGVQHFDLLGAGMGLGSIAALVLAKRFWPGFPAVIVVMGAAALASRALGYEAGGGAVVGALPAGLPQPYWPGALPWGTLGALIMPLLWLTPALHHVPQSVLAAVVVTAITGLIKPALLPQLWRISRVEATIGALTFVVTLAAAPNLYWGVLAGLVVNLRHFLYQRLHPRIIEVGLHPDGSLRDRHLWHLPPLAPHLLALRMDAELDFASASALERTLSERMANFDGLAHVCLFAQPINRIDVTGVETFARLQALVQRQGCILHLSGLKLPVEQALERAHVLVPGPQLRTYRTDTEALQALQRITSAS